MPSTSAVRTTVFFCSLLAAARLPAQAPPPEHPVRLTVRDSLGERRLIGHLTSVTPDSLSLRVADGNTTLAFDRRNVERVERQRGGSLAKWAGVGCVGVGGIFGLLGSQVHDPDSPGIERVLPVVGFVAGCGVGAVGGAVIHLVRRRSWEEITL